MGVGRKGRKSKARKPRRLRAPKTVAFCAMCAATFRAGDGSDEGELLEFGGRIVRAKKYPSRTSKSGKKTSRPGQYFAFSRKSVANGANGMTPTHKMMQAIICDTLFVQCAIGSDLFHADLEDATPERTRPGDIASARGTRRPDITASCRESSLPSLDYSPLDIEIAVTNPVKELSRYLDLIKAGRPCLELLVKRDEQLESEPNALEMRLRELLAAAKLPGRWIVDPLGEPAKILKLFDLQTRIEELFHFAKLNVERADVALRQSEAERTRLLSIRADTGDERMLIDALARETERLTSLAQELDRVKGARGSLFDMIVEAVLPALQDARLKTQAARRKHILDAMAGSEHLRSGLQTRVRELVRAHSRAKQLATDRLQVEEEIAANGSRLIEQRRISVELDLALKHAQALAEKGVQHVVRPKGHTVRDILAFEYARWCS
jgi:hypothetical protein